MGRLKNKYLDAVDMSLCQSAYEPTTPQKRLLSLLVRGFSLPDVDKVEGRGNGRSRQMVYRLRKKTGTRTTAELAGWWRWCLTLDDLRSELAVTIKNGGIVVVTEKGLGVCGLDDEQPRKLI